MPWSCTTIREIAGAGPIAGLVVAELPDLVPLLDAAIAACGDLVVNIELKDLPGEPGWDPGYPLAAMVAGFVAERDLPGRVVVSSFELAALDAVRLAEPGDRHRLADAEPVRPDGRARIGRGRRPPRPASPP